MSLLVTSKAKVALKAYDYCLCALCQTVYVSSEITGADLDAMYVDIKQFTGGVYRDPARVPIALEFYTSVLRRLLADIGKPTAQVKILEIGAGLSWISRCAKAIDPTIFTVAQDLTAQCAEECTWVDRYIAGDIETKDVAALGPFDIVSMTHVIEHLPDPVESLRVIRRLLTSAGRLFISAPHRPAEWLPESPVEVWRAWSYNHVPGHLQYFSQRSLAMSARMADFEIASLRLGEGGQSFEAVLRPITP